MVQWRKRLLGLWVGIIVLCAGIVGTTTSARVVVLATGMRPTNSACHKLWAPQLLGIRRQVVYERLGDRRLTFYLFQPNERTNVPRPVVIYIHGGALKFGTGIISCDNTPHNRLLVALEKRLIQENVDFISVNYRLAPVHPWPIPLNDVKHAVDFVVAHARTMHIRPDDMAVMGDSAGGELASFVGLTMMSGPAKRPVVRAVIDLFGPTDRETFAQQWRRRHGLRPNPVYGIYTPKRVQRESAISHVHRGAPPFLIVQGTRDRVVPPEQSRLLQERLQADGVGVQEILVHHAGHELVPENGPIRPSLATLARCMNQFLMNHLTT